MPVKGYDSVNVPSGLYNKIKALIKNRSDLGYRSVTEFVAEAVRTRLVDMGETAPRRWCVAPPCRSKESYSQGIRKLLQTVKKAWNFKEDSTKHCKVL